MPEKKYRVIQFMTGDVGQVGIRHFAACPLFELVAVLVQSPEKVGKDAGEIAGIGPIGVIATDDVEAIVAMDADCVFFTPVMMDLETVCRLLRSGKNVVTTSGFFYPTEDFAEECAEIRQACQDGASSFHAAGIHPGFAGDVLPLTLARVMSRIDQIRVYEVVNILTAAPLDHIEWLGFGTNKDEFLSEPTVLGMGQMFFAQSMYMIADGLGVHIDEVTAAEVKAAVATEDIPHELGAIARGTVAAQHHEWTAWVNGKPLIVFHAIYVASDKLEPAWDWGKTRYRIVMDGDPPSQLVFESGEGPEGAVAHPGYNWTAMAAINAIPDVCDAAPGWLTHHDLGLLQPRGLVRN
jgi:hypothetical protein